MDKRDYYEVLGLSRDADPAAIKSAYRRAAMQHHPDRNQGDQAAEDKFKEAAEAYEVLSNPDKRAAYDQFGHTGPRQQGFEGFGGVDEIFSHFAEFFGGGGAGAEFFGGGRGGRRQRAARVDVALTFDESVKGTKKEVTVQRSVACEHCGGSGAKRGSTPTACATCAGRGQVMQSMGFVRIASTCPTCRGQGRVVKDKCDECRGGGVVRKTSTITVDVPAGIDDGRVMQASLSGDPLLIAFSVTPHERLQREGDDLHVEVPLTFAQAALGATVLVPGIDGEHEVDVDPGTQPGTVRSLRGEGVPHLEARGAGDLHVHYTVTIPTRLSDEQRRLVEQLAATEAPPGGPGEEEQTERGLFGRRKKKRK